MRALVIIPAYNEGAAIRGVVDSLLQAAPIPGVELDYLVVNDCSRDDTAQVCERAGIERIDLPSNLGIGGAVQTGYIYARQMDYDLAIQMDGDGQHRPEYLPALLQPILSQEADMVVGSRFLEGKGYKSSPLRRLGIRMLSGDIRLATGKRVSDVTSGFRAVNRQGILLFSHSYAKDFPEPESIVRALRNGLRVSEVPVRMAPRESGSSSIGGAVSAYYMIKVTLAVFLTALERRELPRREDGK